MTTIKSSREIDSVFRAARRVAHPLFILLIAQTPEGRGLEGRVAFVAGKKLGKAVLRNRCRRVMRESVRRVGGPWAGWDVVLVAKAAVALAGSQALDSALAAALQRGGVR